MIGHCKAVFLILKNRAGFFYMYWINSIRFIGYWDLKFLCIMKECSTSISKFLYIMKECSTSISKFLYIMKKNIHVWWIWCKKNRNRRREKMRTRTINIFLLFTTRMSKSIENEELIHICAVPCNRSWPIWDTSKIEAFERVCRCDWMIGWPSYLIQSYIPL